MAFSKSDVCSKPQPTTVATSPTVALQPLVIEYTWSVDEAIRAHDAELGNAKVWGFAAFVILGVVLLTFATVDVNTFEIQLRPGWMVVGFALATWPLWNPILRRVHLERMQTNVPAANRIVRWTISETGLHRKNGTDEVRIKWTMLTKVRESCHGFTVFARHPISCWLPKSAFADHAAVEQLCALIEQRGISFKR